MAVNANDPSTNKNQRLPPLTMPGSYPYVEFHQGRSGSWWRRDETPSNEGYSYGHVSGSFHEQNPDGDHKALSSGQEHSYVTQGSTRTVDMNHHEKIGGSTAHQISADHYSEHGNDHMSAIGGDTIHATGGIHFHHATGGTQQTSTGDHVSDHNDGNHHINIEGDHIQYTGGTKYASIGAEYGVYVPNGNIDHTSSGNNQSRANNVNIIAQNNTTINCVNFTVNATSSILLNVSGNQIQINAMGMTIITATGNVNIIAQNSNVNITGLPATIIQGGGLPSGGLTVE
jgi:hypothetical protein